jgi:hypothetical protein
MKLVSVLLVVGLLFLVGCAAHVHTIGNGPQKNEMIQTRQWYALWGYLPLNDVDTHAMAGDVMDYEIRTEATALDVIIGAILGQVTITSRTVTVTR